MSYSGNPVTDHRGVVMFHCSYCMTPLTVDDFIELGLRIPDPSESRDDYCDAELIDSLQHLRCAAALRRARPA